MDNLFSVIIPNYNKEKYITQTIRSVLNQTYTEFEIIIIDDGSTDNSIEIIKSFSDNRIRLISQQNQGVSVARNRGIEEAQYPLIAFLDSDDIWFPFFLEKMNQLINMFPDAGAYGCVLDRKKIKEDDCLNYSWEQGTEKDYIIENYFQNLLFGGGTLTASSTVIRKDIIPHCGVFPLGLKNWEDYDMWIRVALYSKICFTDLVCGVYNDVAGSASRDKSNLHAPVFENYRYHIKNSKIQGQKKRDFIKLVIEKKQHAAYERYMYDRKVLPALNVYIKTIFYSYRDILFWSSILQFVFTPEKVYCFKNKLEMMKNGR